MAIATLGVLIGMLLPAVQSAGETAANPRGFSWEVDALNFIEQGNFASLIDITRTPFSPANVAAEEMQIPVSLCPSDPVSEDNFVARNESTDEKYADASCVANWEPATGFVDSPSNGSDVYYLKPCSVSGSEMDANFLDKI